MKAGSSPGKNCTEPRALRGSYLQLIVRPRGAQLTERREVGSREKKYSRGAERNARLDEYRISGRHWKRRQKKKKPAREGRGKESIHSYRGLRI